MKYIIYCRKSTDTEDKQVLSLDSQRDELLRLAEAQNLNVVEILVESKSAKEPGRPIFNTMMTKIMSGEADAILCWKIDRLTRNPVDGGQIQWLLQKEHIKCITTFEKSYFPNDNVLIMSIEQAMANQYLRDLSVNVKRGNRAKLERGEWPNHAPFGYLNDKATKTIKVNPKEAKFVKRAYELYASGGYSLKEISEILFQEGLRTNSGKKVFKNQIHRFIVNRFYAGVMERDGKIYKGNHKPIITHALFKQAEDVRLGRLHPKPKKHFYSARGFLTCNICGCGITADTKKGHQYYYCTNAKGICHESKKYLKAEEVHKMLSGLFLELKFDEELIEISAEAYKQKHQTGDSYYIQAEEGIVQELKMLEIKESNLVDGFITQIIKKPQYEAKLKEIETEKINLEQQLSEIKQKGRLTESTFEQIKNIFLDGNKASNQYLKVDDTARRRMLEKLLSNALIESQSVAQYKFKSEYQVLANAPKNATILEMLGALDDLRTPKWVDLVKYPGLTIQNILEFTS